MTKFTTHNVLIQVPHERGACCTVSNSNRSALGRYLAQHLPMACEALVERYHEHGASFESWPDGRETELNLPAGNRIFDRVASGDLTEDGYADAVREASRPRRRRLT
jgi:hypothetical protein